MAVIQDIIAALWHHDFAALANPHVVGVVYLVMFATLFLENGLLPASFLPGDSLLLLAGALIARGCMDFVATLAILTSAASLGCWLSYIQMAWQYAGGEKLAVTAAGEISRAGNLYVRSPRSAGAAGGAFSRFRTYLAAYHGGHFRPL